ncbi:MAG: hypothetical protein EU531_11435 [Promethearchaeota archaeon]|nr:MAG: hypothetical protein EU531_11435 [Candidatus Lokiarchaeota archaeon]
MTPPICRADYKENKDNRFLLTHVLLTMDGIAFQKLGKNQFYYWYSRPEHEIIFGKQKITVDGFQRFEKIQDVVSPIYSDEDFKIIQNISEIGINEFIELIRISYNAGFKEEVQSIVEKALELTSKEERKSLLEFRAEIKC